MPRCANFHGGGAAIADLIRAITNPKYETEPFPGERHMVMIDGDKNKVGIKGNYLGPGTQVEKRMARGDKGINKIDEVAKAHDIAYLELGKEIKKGLSRDQVFDRVKAADANFINDLRNVSKKDGRLTASLAQKAIQLKNIAQISGILPKDIFVGGGIDTECDSFKQLCKETSFPHQLLAGQVKGGFLPVAIAGIGMLARILIGAMTSKGIDVLVNKLSGKGLSGGSLEIDIKTAADMLAKKSKTKQIEILHDVIQETGEEAFKKPK